MRKMHVPVLSALLCCILCTVTASAAPITYTITFLDDDGAPSISPPTTGSFTYDSATATFTTFHVTWYGFVYDLTSEANSPTGSQSDPCFAGASGAVASFALLTAGTCPAEWGVGNFTQGDGGSSLSFIHSTAGQLQFLDTREFNPNVPDSPGLPASNFAAWGHFFVEQVTPPGTVAEPTSLLLLGAGVAALVGRRRFAKRP